uniref:Putative secreted protein n=1 Tax=Ixodes ricinus TaxID=34613 RepID=A0A6B0UJH8_IXORI
MTPRSSHSSLCLVASTALLNTCVADSRSRFFSAAQSSGCFLFAGQLGRPLELPAPLVLAPSLEPLWRLLGTLPGLGAWLQLLRSSSKSRLEGSTGSLPSKCPQGLLSAPT